MFRRLLSIGKNLLTKFIIFVRRPRGALITGIGVIIFGFLLSMTQGNPLEAYDIGEVVRKDVISIVDVTGRVEPAERVNMALEKGGKVARIDVGVGDSVQKGKILLSISNADLYADLADTQANLEIERLELNEIAKTSKINFDNTREDLIREIEDAYVVVDDAVYNKADQVFYDEEPIKEFGAEVISGGRKDTLGASINEQMDIERARRDIGDALDDWSEAKNNIENLGIEITEIVARDTLSMARTFLSDLALILNSYRESQSPNTIVDGYRTNIGLARTNINGAIKDLQTVRQAYLSAKAQAVVEEEQSLQDVLLQEQRVKNAEARVNAVWAEIAKTLIKAPFDGVITRIDTEVGEIVSSSNSVISMMSGVQFEIETFIPEADIAEIVQDNSADVTLDAYSSDVFFGAYVSFIDPAETIIEGVATYKVLLQFNEEDERIRSGMTANVDIVTGVRENALSVPQRAVIEKDGLKFVRVVIGDEAEEVEVQTGLRGFDGDIEILSGLSERDEIVVFVRG